jgi:hypothetical protein
MSMNPGAITPPLGVDGFHCGSAFQIAHFRNEAVPYAHVSFDSRTSRAVDDDPVRNNDVEFGRR